jgi:hypothetical protein
MAFGGIDHTASPAHSKDRRQKEDRALREGIPNVRFREAANIA